MYTHYNTGDQAQNPAQIHPNLGISIREGKAVVSSRDVAEKFGKEHGKILRSIRELDCSASFNEANFGFVEYTDAKGEYRPEVLMTRDGFTFLAMGFTGTQAARFKEAYITEFNRMEAELKSREKGERCMDILSDPRFAIKMLEALADEKDRNHLLAGQIEDDAPYANYGRAVEVARGSSLIGEFAKILVQAGMKTGQNRLFKQLRDMRILGKTGHYRNVPMQQYIDAGYFVLNYRIILRSSGSQESKVTPYITPRGKIWLMKRFGIKNPDSVLETLDVLS